ncbi:hypothetical protein PUN28_015775 [Cardiocondyla obscurior]|uniref:CCHC-type domain-containing protein n=1 Tax=Cardiocondyla obscurior TaxID=286306 RepID=A0AAW2EZW5_9HYME
MAVQRSPVQANLGASTSANEGNEREGTSEIDELRAVIRQQNNAIQRLQQIESLQTASERSPQSGITEGILGNYFRFSLKDALEAVPSFDGENISFVYFVGGCEEALSMVAPSQEINLVRAVRNKLKGDAHRSILGKAFNNMREFVEFLRTKYGPRESVYEAQGRLAYLCQKKDEKVVAYANRVRELGKRILDAQKRETGEISEEFKKSVDEHLKTSFLRGINKEIIINKEGSFDLVEGRAIETEKELETSNMIRRLVLAENTPMEKKASARRVEAEVVSCQYCQKKGHTADKCWQINRPQVNRNGNRNMLNTQRDNVTNQSNNNFRRERTTFMNQNPINRQQNFNTRGNNFLRPNFNRNLNNTNQNYNHNGFNQNTIICMYCKKPGHILKECRKRIYDNSQQNFQNQGNGQIPAKNGATPGNIKTRPTRMITGEPESQSEQ